MAIEKLVCLYHKLTAYVIQNCLMFFNVLGLILHFFGFALILWEIISNFTYFLYVFCLVIHIFSIICLAITIYFRYKTTINSRNNAISQKISVVMIFLSIFGMIFSLLCFIIVWYKYYNYEDETIYEKNYITSLDWFFMFLILGDNYNCISFYFSFWICIYIRLKKKTNGAFIKNEEAINNTSTSSDSRIVTVRYGNREINLK